MKITNKTKVFLLFIFCLLLISSYYICVHYKQVNNFAVFNFNDQKYKESSNAFKQLVKIKKDNFFVKYNYAASLYKLNDLDDSLELYNKLLNYKNIDNINKAELYFNIGNIFFLKDEYSLAIENYKASLLLNPNDYETKYNIEYIYSLTKKMEDPKTLLEEREENIEKQKEILNKREENLKQQVSKIQQE